MNNSNLDCKSLAKKFAYIAGVAIENFMNWKSSKIEEFSITLGSRMETHAVYWWYLQQNYNRATMNLQK